LRPQFLVWPSREEGGAIGALAGALFLLVLLNVVTLSSLNPFTRLIVQGIVILVAVVSFSGPQETFGLLKE